MLSQCTNRLNISHANNRPCHGFVSLLSGVRQSCEEQQCLYENLVLHMNKFVT